MNKRRLGGEWEKVAVARLQECGYHIVATNYRCRHGELDVVAREGGYLVFLEVKYRTSAKQGYPAEAVTPKKMKTIVRTAGHYMLHNRIAADEPCRFDVISILGGEIHLLKDAFEADCNV